MVRTPEQMRIYAREYRKKYPERMKALREKNKEYHKEYIKKYRTNNSEKIKEYSKKYRIKHGDNLNKRHRERKYIIKQKLIKEMGGKCVCCGINTWWVLTFDHIIPIKYKREHAENLIPMLRDNIEKRKEFQIMCFGCNNSKDIGKKCKIHE